MEYTFLRIVNRLKAETITNKSIPMVIAGQSEPISSCGKSKLSVAV